MKFIIDFKNQATEAEITAYLNSFSGTVVKTFNRFEKTFLIESATVPPESALVEHCINDDAETINLLGTVFTLNENFGRVVNDGSLPTVTITNNQDQDWWKYYSLNSPDLDAPTYTFNRWGSGNTVYVLDSGCNTSLSEFAGTDIQNIWSFTGDFNDTNGHGTAIASLIVGNNCGVTNAAVKNVKIFDSNVVTKQSDLIAALDAIYNDWAANSATAVGYSIVNASWAITKNALIESKIQSLIDLGIVFVAAAGNNGVAIENVTPASMASVITVGSYNQDLQPSNFSNYTGGSAISYTSGDTNYGALDGWAPGEKIWIAKTDGTYAFAAGTSMAAAIHSAALAVNLRYNGITYPVVPGMQDVAFGRQDLLDLTDPRYSNSVNKITTIICSFAGQMDSAPLVYDVQLRYGFHNAAQVANVRLVEKVEFMADLPYGLTLTPYGKLVSEMPPAPAGQRHEEFVIPAKATYRDGTEEEFNLNLYVVALDWNSATDSTGDQDLDLKLQYTYPCYQWGDCIYNEHSCANNCPWLAWCTNANTYCPKGAYACWCDGI
jgi:hypothetical protein